VGLQKRRDQNCLDGRHNCRQKRNIRRGNEYYFTFYKTDKPRPEPIDPATLENVEGDINADIPEEDEETFEEIHEDLEALQDAAEDAELTGESDVES
jgi:hypothetical protein